MGIFGSSGVRGVVNREFTPELATMIGMAVGGDAETAVVGTDSRTSGPMIEAAVSSGLMASGCQVYSAGLVTTPTLAEAARDSDIGVMITASHNPPEYSGMKLWNPDGSGYGLSQTDRIERLLASKKFKLKKWDEVGCLHFLPDAVERHAERIMSGVGEAKLKVVVDCANGPAFNITPMVLQCMGCRVISMNSSPDGHFPGHPPEPIDENLTDLKRAVVSMKADLGIAHDGDADRMVAVDDKGVFLGSDQLLVLFAKRYAKKKVVVSVDASMVVDDSLDAKVIRTRVGDVFVSEAVKKSKAEFGGEPSGTWIFPDQTFCPDGVLAAARLVELVGNKKLSEMRKKVKVYPTLRRAIPFQPGDRAAILRRLDSEMRSVKSRGLLTLDGYRLQFEDGWTLVRPSGTEPKIRVLAEARNAKRAEAIMESIYSRVKGCVER
jgi:phosphoglucosamine mutase